MEIGTTISAWKFDEKNKKIKRNKSKNTQKNLQNRQWTKRLTFSKNSSKLAKKL